MSAGNTSIAEDQSNTVRLRPFLRPGLDVLFVALNPPVQSNANGHYFSGRTSRFFHLLFASGLITRDVPRQCADEVVFGTTSVNYKKTAFGVIDLVGDMVQTQSGKVRPTRHHVAQVIAHIQRLNPRFVCVIHSKVRDALNQHASLARRLDYGVCGRVLSNCDSQFIINYFPNGNAVPDTPKLKIFRTLREAL
jgi:G:T/U-mismatch repair DNA glycosylase